VIVHTNKLVDKVAKLSLIVSIYLIPTSATHWRLLILKLLLEYVFQVVDQFFVGRIFLKVLFVILNKLGDLLYQLLLRELWLLLLGLLIRLRLVYYISWLHVHLRISLRL
jgi:hypothetical protein